MKKFSSLVAVFCGMLSLPAISGSFVLNEYNVVTIDDFQSNQHVQGKTFVGGDLNGNLSEFGSHVASGEITLQVAGEVNLSSTLKVQNSGLEVSTSNTISADKRYVGSTLIENASSVDYNNDLADLKDDYQTQLEDASQAFAGLEKNSDYTVSGNKTEFIVDGNLDTNDYAVFDYDTLNGIFNDTPNQQIELVANNLSDLAAIVINVAGIDLELASSSNMNGLFSNIEARAKVVWNFYEAQTIDLNNQAFMGTLLAPYASVVTGGLIQGSVGAFSLITTAEIHLPTTEVTPPKVVEVPEPSTYILMILSGALIYFRRNSV